MTVIFSLDLKGSDVVEKIIGIVRKLFVRQAESYDLLCWIFTVRSAADIGLFDEGGSVKSQKSLRRRKIHLRQEFLCIAFWCVARA